MVCYVFSRLFMPPAFSFRAKPLSYFYDKNDTPFRKMQYRSKCLCATTIPCGQSRRSEGANCYPALLLLYCIMDDATFVSDAVSMNRRRLMAIRSHQEGTAGCDAAADDSRDGMTLNKEQLTALSLLLL